MWVFNLTEEVPGGVHIGVHFDGGDIDDGNDGDGDGDDPRNRLW